MVVGWCQEKKFHVRGKSSAVGGTLFCCLPPATVLSSNLIVIDVFLHSKGRDLEHNRDLWFRHQLLNTKHPQRELPSRTLSFLQLSTLGTPSLHSGYDAKSSPLSTIGPSHTTPGMHHH
ncbi:hypothetical protein B0H65DRAFT_440921 [Neurospora tetraspora]|uniref:Uncharacterized protein n=1 Tax=Neurospora tetraspora TaxID=94610 RepID=A0AAE0JMH5_9PEZI|nr:hypothetical protein B0H65DRAFT_440921 [Neurospora tetraspora]